jgi:hypothetical protein
MPGIEKIISGGQTGADRAALDVALELGVLCGGWCPRGRIAEDGPLADRYPLVETPSELYEQRTEWNIRDSDGTLVVTRGEPTGGTAFTIEAAVKYGRPLLVVDMEKWEAPQEAASEIREWQEEQRIRVLNVAGPRRAKNRRSIAMSGQSCWRF